MTFQPIAPVAVLIAIAILLVGIRMAALYRVLVRTGTGRYRRVVLRWSALTAAGLLLVLAAGRPGLPHDTGQANAKPAKTGAANANIFFVVDRSVDGRVEDYADGKSRLSGIRSDITALIDQYPRARFSIIEFASKAGVDWPLSDDVWSLKPFVKGLSAYTEVPEDAMYQVNIAAANDVLRTQLDSATKQYKDSKNLVFYFGEGAGGSRTAQSGFDIAHGAIAGGAVLGYGTPAGGLIPMGFYNGNLVYMWDKQNNRAANSAINEDGLKAIAAELGVPYFHRDNSPITPVVPAVDLSSPAPGDTPVSGSVSVERTELYWLFTGLAAVLALGETFLTLREFRRNRIPRRVRQ
ncbi:Secreted protein containing bacterial Ig-like domain and vWFA domain [Mycobacterium rhizamassiliense]|uniref:Secreted protein containing bacterial Ig-like domain and vWFA domain n=1 Tax=Mycobacterium rhizamassiliense TaxID=1841860 RepID=A0A2U3NQ64_9MYCO|nr:VWA domain-containing protein [Mycobacterium rhizamassiliense]SPM33659.1 Secreted protein containing bacterial Ig-like domain and vWFA domain [Mycobacterium rhizamassiliense]